MISELVIGIAALIGFALAGFGLWAFGQWLRRKGHNEKLDRIDLRITRSKAVIRRYLINPILDSTASTLSKAPIFGKHYRKAFKNTDKQKNK